jgi:hypothetical protein
VDVITMSGTSRFLIPLVAVVLVLCAGCTQPSGVQTDAPPHLAVVNLSVPFGPVPVNSLDGANIAYELEIEPAPGQIPVVYRVEVIDPSTGTVLYMAEDQDLASLYHPADVPPPTADGLQNGTLKLTKPRVSLWFVVRPDGVPDRLSHRLTLNRTTDSMPPITITGAEVSVRKDCAPVVIGAPVEGPGWLAMETTSPMTHHFRTQVTMDGVTRVPQRYAQDWVFIDPSTGDAAHGDLNLSRNFYGYGRVVLAVANGTVTDVSDDMPDPERTYSALPFNFATAAGNYVIMDIGDGKYACYAHLQNGSVNVKAGDRVNEGNVIGQVGNSGSSDFPHLHFQVVTDTPSFLGAEGYPHVYRSFNVTGTVNMTRAGERLSIPGYCINRIWSEFSPLVDVFESPLHQEKRLVENNAIVTFR